MDRDIDAMNSQERDALTSLERDALEQEKRNKRFLGLFGRKKKRTEYGKDKNKKLRGYDDAEMIEDLERRQQLQYAEELAAANPNATIRPTVESVELNWKELKALEYKQKHEAAAARHAAGEVKGALKAGTSEFNSGASGFDDDGDGPEKKPSEKKKGGLKFASESQERDEIEYKVSDDVQAGLDN